MKNEIIGRNKTEQSIIDKVSKNNPNVFYFWNELTDVEKDNLIKDLSSIDLEQEASFYDKYYKNLANEPIDFDSTEYFSRIDMSCEPDIKDIGEEALHNGKVAFLTVAGGQASRLDYDYPKGCFPISPINAKSLFQIFAEKILFYSKYYNVDLNWYIMTSDSNYDDTTTFFEKNDFWGLKKSAVTFFKQGMLATITIENKLILEEKSKIFRNPDGHGGILTALFKSGLLQQISDKGIQYISYFQVDNPLVNMADPYFIGYHIKNNLTVSTKVIKKLYPEEKIGVIGKKNGRPSVIEYSDLPEEMQYAKENGELKYLMGSIGIHIFSVDFLIHFTEKLPIHVALKKVHGYNFDDAIPKKAEVSAIKFETFVFDMITLADRCGFFETTRVQEFFPLKNKTGLDSIDSCRKGQIGAFIDWLIVAGLIDDTEAFRINRVEISPMFAPDKEIFVQKVALNKKFILDRIYDKNHILKTDIDIKNS